MELYQLKLVAPIIYLSLFHALYDIYQLMHLPSIDQLNTFGIRALDDVGLLSLMFLPSFSLEKVMAIYVPISSYLLQYNKNTVSLILSIDLYYIIFMEL